MLSCCGEENHYIQKPEVAQCRRCGQLYSFGLRQLPPLTAIQSEIAKIIKNNKETLQLLQELFSIAQFREQLSALEIHCRYYNMLIYLRFGKAHVNQASPAEMPVPGS